ncbi:L-2-hydroxyglutarate oxidase [Helicobacter saguini]|uniref:L-2-hydroxyglutarate oxidase n=1 Tax=Helicobacter saguini TaxID=1548018 RepID=A0A347VU28_9HELI|nr:L-2-hydroxyglutarate oxidase [Helicobacter saguini]MWV68378.1 L-2-hydroxyglutarate oxidase [Helicobacter saguini]MWV70158.1 L-2-hydroxyglutarate oxidase [Helicobacter saguini]MWV72061.1 L-2-hydroxyglutarate oxidase [Helicobacter saguini]TLD93776.1 L-2-hydroxyglutarate oxidase [Helicobacter saguini]
MYDFIIVGGGIIGMSVAMQLQKKLPDSKIAVLEKESDVAKHQTGHNSGVIHAGVYYTPGSLKAKFCFEGNKATKDFCDENGIKYDICGKMLVATNDVEMERMKALWDRTEANGLERTWLDSNELRAREPNIIGVGGIFFPSSGIVSYTEVTKAMMRRFMESKGEVFLNTQVVGLTEHTNGIVVKTNKGQFEGQYLITCGGLQSDRLVSMLDIAPDFVICPFRGEYYQLSPQHNNIVKHLIYPIPDPSVPFLGVHLTRMIDGSVTVGPNAVLAFKREGYKKTDISLPYIIEMLKHKGIRKVIKDNFKTGLEELKNSLFKDGYLKLVQKYCPSLTKVDLNPYPAGVRAQAVSNDGKLIEDFLFVNTNRAIFVCNAPSPAATSAIPIGAHILEKVDSMVNKKAEITNL